jgi:hypothetical protein
MSRSSGRKDGIGTTRSTLSLPLPAQAVHIEASSPYVLDVDHFASTLLHPPPAPVPVLFRAPSHGHLKPSRRTQQRLMRLQLILLGRFILAFVLLLTVAFLMVLAEIGSDRDFDLGVLDQNERILAKLGLKQEDGLEGSTTSNVPLSPIVSVLGSRASYQKDSDKKPGELLPQRSTLPLGEIHSDLPLKDRVFSILPDLSISHPVLSDYTLNVLLIYTLLVLVLLPLVVRGLVRRSSLLAHPLDEHSFDRLPRALQSFQLLQRVIVVLAFLYILRTGSFTVTTLPNPKLGCEASYPRTPGAGFGDWVRLAGAMVAGEVGACTDNIFSGHTALALLCFLSVAASFHGAWFLKGMSAFLTVAVLLSIVSTHFHYTVDVFLSLIITNTVFWGYHLWVYYAACQLYVQEKDVHPSAIPSVPVEVASCPDGMGAMMVKSSCRSSIVAPLVPPAFLPMTPIKGRPYMLCCRIRSLSLPLRAIIWLDGLDLRLEYETLLQEDDMCLPLSVIPSK